MLYAVVKALAALLLRLLFRLESGGAEHVPTSGPVLLVANHVSVLDPPSIGVAVPRELAFLAKAELFDIPLFGRLLRRLHVRPVRRGGTDPGALRAGLRTLQQDGALLVFPEGSRGDEGVLRPPKGGAGMLAVLSGAPVVPVFVSGSGRAWPRGRWCPRPAKVRVAFGPPLRFDSPAGGDRKADYTAVSRAMMAAIGRLRDGAALDGATSPPVRYSRRRHGRVALDQINRREERAE